MAIFVRGCLISAWMVFLLRAQHGLADEPKLPERPVGKLRSPEESALRKLEHQMSNKFKFERDLEAIAKLPEIDEPTKKYRDTVLVMLKRTEELIAKLDPDGSLREKLPPTREYERQFSSHQRLLEQQRYYASPAGLKDKRLAEKLAQLETAIGESERSLLKQDPTGRWRKILEAKALEDAGKPKLPPPAQE